MPLFDRSKEPDDSTPLPPAYDVERPITASAAKITARNINEISVTRKNAQWQSDCWNYYHYVPIINFAGHMLKSILSRVRFYIAYVQDTADAPIYIRDEDLNLDSNLLDICTRAQLRLSRTQGGISGLFATTGLNLWVAGEGTLVEFPATAKNGMQSEFKFLSTSQFTSDGKKYHYQPSKKSKSTQTLPIGSTYAARIWSPDPEFDHDAESSLKSVQDACDEALAYMRLRRILTLAQLNAGIFLVPDTINSTEVQTQDTIPDLDSYDEDFDVTSIAQADIPDTESDEVEDALIEMISASIDGDDSGASVIPLVLRGPKEDLKEVRYLTFDRKMQDQVNESYRLALEAIKTGLDITEDSLNSQQGVRYSNRQSTDEQFYKNHLEPLLVAVCDAYTTVYLRPYLLGCGVPAEVIERLVFWFDPSALTVRSNKAESSNDGADRGYLSAKSWREVNGYSESDAPSGEEIFLKAAMARFNVSDQLLTLILKEVAPDLAEKLQTSAEQANPDLSERAKDLLGYNTGAPEAPSPDAPETPTTPDTPQPGPKNMNPVNGEQPNEGISDSDVS